MNVGRTPIRFQVDSGARCNVIPVSKLDECGIHYKLSTTSTVLTSYDKTKMRPLGKTSLKLVNPKTKKLYNTEFVVVEQENIPILGSQTIQEMKLVTIHYDNILAMTDDVLTEQSVFSQYKDVFDGTGSLEGTCILQTDPSVKPIVHPPRKIPVALRERLKTELDCLAEKGIIASVTGPTPWLNNLVIVVKPNKLRICIDPPDLNGAIQRSHYPMPTVEELLPDLHKAKVFSVANAKNGF